MQPDLHISYRACAKCLCMCAGSRLVIRLFIGQQSKNAPCDLLCLVQETGADPGAGGKRRVVSRLFVSVSSSSLVY